MMLDFIKHFSKENQYVYSYLKEISLPVVKLGNFSIFLKSRLLDSVLESLWP